MSSDNYPITVYHIPSLEGMGYLAEEHGFTALAKAIAESHERDLQNVPEGDIIVPKEESDAPELSRTSGQPWVGILPPLTG